MSFGESVDKKLNEEKELSNQLGSQASELEDQKNQLEIGKEIALNAYPF